MTSVSEMSIINTQSSDCKRNGRNARLGDARVKITNADMAELADAQVSGSCGRPCRFNSCYPHHKETIILVRKISVLWFFYCQNRGVFPFFIGFIAKMEAYRESFRPCKLFLFLVEN